MVMEGRIGCAISFQSKHFYYCLVLISENRQFWDCITSWSCLPVNEALQLSPDEPVKIGQMRKFRFLTYLPYDDKDTEEIRQIMLDTVEEILKTANKESIKFNRWANLDE